MSNFNLAIPTILKHEAGWVNDPDDLGGETNFGISTLIINREKITPEELGLFNFNPGALKQMSVEAAKRVYQRIYWNRYKYRDIVNQSIATKVFDAAVNMGPYWGHLLAQKAANACGALDLDLDGKIGPLTIAGLNACNPDAWLAAMVDAMVEHYKDLVVKRASNAKFLKGWLKRAAWVG